MPQGRFNMEAHKEANEYKCKLCNSFKDAEGFCTNPNCPDSKEEE